MSQLFGSETTRKIWGEPENVLLIYAGAAAEFALNPENHWLFYTGKLPSDPLRRFQETLRYQQRLFFMPEEAVPQVARHIKDMHRQVEVKRSKEEGKTKISDRAYLQVFSMLIEYGIAGYEYLHLRKMTRDEKEEYFNDILSVSRMMEIQDFPPDYHQYLTQRTEMVVRELQINPRTWELLESYRRALGRFRYWSLLQFQARFIDPILSRRLGLKAGFLFGLIYRFYPLIRFQTLFKGLTTFFLEGKTRLALKELASRRSN
jgi:hypothetical protein